MAKFEYYMVYLPRIQPRSFLLFVYNLSEGSNKLRDYSTGHAHEMGQPGIKAVFDETRETATRFQNETLNTKDNDYWYQVTRSLNQRHLSGEPTGTPVAAPSRLAPPPVQFVDVVQGRAKRG